MSGIAPQPAPSREGAREKLDRLGVAALSDAELLALVLGHGTAGAPARQLAAALLDQASGLHGLTRMTLDEVCGLPGIGTAQACRVLASIELGRRTLAHPRDERPQFLLPRESAAYLLPRYGAHPVERFGALFLDTKHRLLRTRILSEGTLDAALAHPREVFRAAVGAGAACLIVFHNHPSGDPQPSPEDHALTLRLARAGSVVGVPLVDHVVLAGAVYWSFKEHGMI